MKRSWEQNPWDEPYRLAVFEENFAQMPERIAAARFAIRARIEDLVTSADQTRELEALYHALKVLRLLEVELRRKSAG